MKTFFLTGILLALLSSSVTWAATASGYLSVFTGKPKAEIFIDGQFVANEFVNRYELESGSHYVRIIYAGKLMFAKMVDLEPSQLRTITSENFVDIRTNAVSRGALTRETKRVKETKGQFGIGGYVGSRFPASGVSLKWTGFGPVGIQVSGIGGVSIENASHSNFGMRVIYNVGDKLFGNTLFNGYIAPGILFEDSRHDSNAALSYTATSVGMNIGAEFSLFDPVYFSLEAGTVYYKRSIDSSGNLEMSYAVGVHFFF